MPNPLLEAALSYAARGYPVFRCAPGGKEPLESNGFHDATADATEIRRRWAESPSANIGIPAGKASGFDVVDLDIDPKRGDGVQQFEDLLKTKAPLNMSVIVKTPSSGHHIYFKHAGMPCTVGRLAPAIDTRGDGGYVVVPPSATAEGCYTFDSGGGTLFTAELPDAGWLVQAVGERKAPAVSSDWKAPLTDKLTESQIWAALEEIKTSDRVPEQYKSCVERMKRGEELFPAKSHDAGVYSFLSFTRFKLGALVSDATILRLMKPSVLAMQCADHGMPHATEKLAKVNGEYGGRLAEQEFVMPPQPWAPGATSTEIVSVAYPLNDKGAASRLVSLFAAKELLYVPSLSTWRRYSGGVWSNVIDGPPTDLVNLVSAAIARDANESLGDDRKKLFAHADHLSSSRGIDAMSKLARRRPEMTREPDDFDRDPMLLNVANGTLNLKTGVLQPHNAADCLTKISPITYDPNATCPLFQTFLAQVLPLSDIRDYLKRLVGYWLLGHCREHGMTFFHGNGANGKSVLLGLVRRALGSYCVVSNPSMIIRGLSNSEQERARARLKGARLVILGELPSGAVLDTSAVKQLTGGDTIIGAGKFQHEHEIRATFKLVLMSNHNPRVYDRDEGIWRRLQDRVPFRNRISEATKNPNLEEELAVELPGILTWMVQGCLEYQQFRLMRPESVIAEACVFKADQDSLSDWLDEYTVQGDYSTKEALFASYAQHCERKFQKAPSFLTFCENLCSRDFRSSKRTVAGSRKSCFDGLTLKTERRQPAAPAQVTA